MSLKNWIIIGVISLISTSCNSDKSSQIESPKLPEEELVLETLDGKHIATGAPIEMNGRILPVSQIKITAVEVNNLRQFPEPLIQATSFPVARVSKYTAAPRPIIFGKGNFPNIETKKIGSGEKQTIEPLITQALPFQNEIHEKLSYKNLGISQGLTSTQVTSIFEDSRGYFWFGGKRGITRYDGYSFQYYQLFNDAQQVEMGAILEDKNGNLWMSFSSSGGLMKFDGHHFYSFSEGAGLEFGETYLGLLHADQKGNIWLKSESKVIRFDGENFDCFPYHFQNLKNLNIILKESANGNLWLSALGGVCSINGDQMTYYPIEEYDENNLCHPVMEDERGLIITTGSGISILRNDTLINYPSVFMQLHPARNTLEVGKDFILETEDKKTALCSIDDSALTVFAENAPLFSGSYPEYVDRFKKVWFSTPGKGVQIYNTNGFKHFTFEKMNRGGHIASILEDSKGNIWFGSHGFGLYKFDGSVHTYFPLIANSNELAVRALIEDNEGSIWAGTVDSGLFKIENPHAPNPTIIRYQCFGDTVHSVFSLTQDHTNSIWIGTRANGLVQFDGTNFTQFFIGEKEPVNSPNNIRALITDKNGHVWIGAQNGGVRKFDGKNWTWFTNKEGLRSNHVVSLLEDHQGSIWVGTSDQGVTKMTGNSMLHFATENGLTSNAIWTIIEDLEGNIWLGADNSLNVIPADAIDTYHKDSIKIKTYRNMDGLEGAEFYANATLCDKQGQLWWGTEQMAVMISDPPSLLAQGDVRITLEGLNVVNNRVDFKQLQDSIAAGKDWLIDAEKELNLADLQFSSVTPFSNCPNDLQVPAYLNDISFIYSVSGASNPADIEFSYFMQGVDKAWSAPTKNNKIDYRGLSAGTYTIQTKVSQINGVWSDPISYSFTILPFWWQTWWAYLIWILILALLLAAVFRLLNMRRKEKEDARRIREIESMKSQFYANITHEFRTPLTLIMGMNSEITGHEKQRDIIQRNSEKLLQQINQLLETAKLESGNLTLNLEQKEMIRYLQFLAESFYNFAQDKGIQLTYYSEANAVMMDFDEEKVQGIIYNLLSNAIKFTPVGGKIIFHVTQDTIQHKQYLKIKIKDTGIGIPADQLEKIYHRFYQINKTPNGSAGGTGIGLALTKDLVELMQGKILVESKVGSGTEFTILLPITNQAAISHHENYQRPLGLTSGVIVDTPVESESIQQDAMQILIIEDNKEIANYLKDLLKSQYEIHIAENGLDGITKAFEIIPDAVISDISMPVMDGYEVCHRLKTDERTSHIPVVLITAKVTQKDRIEGLKQGADAYLTKPFHREELEIILQKLIDLRKELQKRYAATILEIPQSTPPEETKANEPVYEVQDAFIAKLNSILEAHLSDSEFGVPELSDAAGMSQMQVYRKLKALTGKTPSQFIRTFRLHKAVGLLKTTQLNVSEIAYEVGFSDPNYFSRTFHQEFGCPPAQYRK
jgi:signal transduction histidine kinase/ligand-binding sensor domain-containing protein/CheY-like chemotaxis protein